MGIEAESECLPTPFRIAVIMIDKWEAALWVWVVAILGTYLLQFRGLADAILAKLGIT